MHRRNESWRRAENCETTINKGRHNVGRSVR